MEQKPGTDRSSRNAQMEDRAYFTTEGERLEVVAFADEDMMECPEEGAFYAIANMPDGALEAVEIIERPRAH
ncbi:MULTISPECIES: hypothetical protein [unclassified Aureimonas]|uniref:hypothetical protein n=1 Tax=unclassified Aureimonas TaxID=2615206 RepID=UPI0012E3E14A|nr:MULTISPECIES: hypothetical protein [unclassified Aureimonas]